MCLQIFIHAFRHFPGPGQLGQWPWLFRRLHQVNGHFPHPWNFIYNAQKLLYLSGWSWFQFSIPVSKLSSISRFGKNTHILRISNSVTHLWSYTNTAIADIIRNSLPGADIVTSNCECFMMFYSISWCFTGGSWCFMHFMSVARRLVSRTTFGIIDHQSVHQQMPHTQFHF